MLLANNFRRHMEAHVVPGIIALGIERAEKDCEADGNGGVDA